ncbi:MAG: alpha/beta fold hydrolase [Casimicrobiaceae bacterium]
MLTRTEPRTHQFRSLSLHGFHRVVYYEWGDPDNPAVVICVHGMGRNGRDFDVLGEALASTHRVLAVDMPGRGASDWLADPMDYVFPTYLATLTALIAASRADTVGWIGTSMGGLLGIVAAAQPKAPVSKLVVSDAGPYVEPAALVRIAGYIGADPTFATFAEYEAHVREVSAPFGPLTDAQWEHIARTNARQHDGGRWGVGYDPRIAVPFRDQPAIPDLWPQWDAIRCPTLVLRGAESDLLSAATAHAMTERGPRARVIEVPGVGHPPMMLDPAQIEPVAQFLRNV